MVVGVDFTGIAIVFICHDGNGRYLFAKRSEGARDEHGCWELPGGGLKFNETVDDALRRELYEEFGCEALSVQFLGYRDVLRDVQGRTTHWLALDFKVRVSPDDVILGEPHKCDAIEWFTLDNLPAPLHSATPVTIEQRRQHLT